MIDSGRLFVQSGRSTSTGFHTWQGKGTQRGEYLETEGTQIGWGERKEGRESVEELLEERWNPGEYAELSF